MKKFLLFCCFVGLLGVGLSLHTADAPFLRINVRDDEPPAIRIERSSRTSEPIQLASVQSRPADERSPQVDPATNQFTVQVLEAIGKSWGAIDTAGTGEE